MTKIKSVLPYLFGTLSFYTILSLEKLNISQLETKLLVISILLLIFYPFIRVLFSKGQNAYHYLGNLFLSYFYVVIPFSILLLIPMINNTKFDTKIILGVFILIWTSDTFAYLVGSKFGKHKLFERISPKKTIEGFVGGLIFTIIASILISKFFITTIPIIYWISIALIVAVFGSLGDLIESMFKRQANIKDSSNLIPGHGGFLDRLDSIIFAAPFILIFLILIQ